MDPSGAARACAWWVDPLGGSTFALYWPSAIAERWGLSLEIVI